MVSWAPTEQLTNKCRSLLVQEAIDDVQDAIVNGRVEHTTVDVGLGRNTRVVRISPKTASSATSSFYDVVIPETNQETMDLPKLCMLTYNVDSVSFAPRWSRPLKAIKIAEIVNKHGISLAVLQEVHNDHVEEIRKKLPSSWGVCKIKVDKNPAGKNAPEYHVFAWDSARLRLRARPRIIAATQSHFLRPPAVAEFEVVGGSSASGSLTEFIVASVHLKSGGGEETRKEVENLGQVLLPALKVEVGVVKARSLIIMGDFNLAPKGINKGTKNYFEPNPYESWQCLEGLGWGHTVEEPTNCAALIKGDDKVYDNILLHRDLLCRVSGDPVGHVIKTDKDWIIGRFGSICSTRSNTDDINYALKAEYDKLAGKQKDALKETKKEMPSKWFSHGSGFSDHRPCYIQVDVGHVAPRADTTNNTLPAYEQAFREACATYAIYVDEHRVTEALKEENVDKTTQCKGVGISTKKPCKNKVTGIQVYCHHHRFQRPCKGYPASNASNCGYEAIPGKDYCRAHWAASLRDELGEFPKSFEFPCCGINATLAMKLTIHRPSMAHNSAA